jgi:hypothetical protein
VQAFDLIFSVINRNKDIKQSLENSPYIQVKPCADTGHRQTRAVILLPVTFGETEAQGV